MNHIPTSPGFAESGSIQNTVAKEMRRRKTLIGIFLALLVVPLAVAVYSVTERKPPRLVVEKTATVDSPSLSYNETAKDLDSQKEQIAHLTEQVANRDQAITHLQQQVAQTKEIAQGAQAALAGLSLSPSQARVLQQALALHDDESQSLLDESLRPLPTTVQAQLKQKQAELQEYSEAAEAALRGQKIIELEVQRDATAARFDPYPLEYRRFQGQITELGDATENLSKSIKNLQAQIDELQNQLPK